MNDNDEKFAQVLLDMLRDDMRRARTSRLRASITSWMTEEVDAHARTLAICEDTRRALHAAAADARTQLRLQRQGVSVGEHVEAQELRTGFRAAPERAPAPASVKNASRLAKTA